MKPTSNQAPGRHHSGVPASISRPDELTTLSREVLRPGSVTDIEESTRDLVKPRRDVGFTGEDLETKGGEKYEIRKA